MNNCILWKKNITLRGHRDDNTSTATNQGNIRALLQLLAESNAELHEHLESGKRNAQLTSKTVQNEIIDVIGDCFKKKQQNHFNSLQQCTP